MSTEHYVDLRLPADHRLLRVARVAAASLAAEMPFTMQDIEDLRIAVDELAAVLMEDAPAGAVLELRFEIEGDALLTSGTLSGAGPLADLHPVAADLLQMVAPGHQLGEQDGVRTFRFVKRAGALTS